LAGNATAHTDHEIGIECFEVFDTTQIGKNFFLRFFSHGTGVEQNDVSVFGVLCDDNATFLSQNIKHFVGVVLIHLTAKGADEYFFGIVCFLHDGAGAGVDPVGKVKSKGVVYRADKKTGA
jgi:hypothetical protein